MIRQDLSLTSVAGASLPTVRPAAELIPLVGCILTLNEEAHIGDAIRSLSLAADLVVVIDSGSQDLTREIARAEGAIVLERPFDNFAAQRNWALDEIEARYAPTWVFSLDADERVPERLASEVRGIATSADQRYDAFAVVRLLRFGGRILRHGGMASTRLLRLFRPSAGRYEHRSVNEHFAVRPGAKVSSLAEPLLHEDVLSWERYIEKHNLYSTLEAQERVDRDCGQGVSLQQAFENPHLRRRWLRERVWNSVPAKPACRFVHSYVMLGGFLDGKPGFDKAMFNAWLEMCIDLKYRSLVATPRRGCAAGDLTPP